jgi:hypothetical protein
MEPGGRSGPAFWVSVAAGAAIVAYGGRGLLVFEPRGAPSALRWLIGSALVVDLVVIPAVGLVGWGLRRAVSATAWPVVRAALIVSGVLVLFSLALVTDQGGTPGNATVRPRNYGEGLAVALVWTWAITGTWLGARTWRRRRSMGS